MKRQVRLGRKVGLFKWIGEYWNDEDCLIHLSGILIFENYFELKPYHIYYLWPN